MATVRQHRATDANLALKTPAQSQLVHNTQTNRIHIGDGTTAGGHPAAKLDEVVRHDAAQTLTSGQMAQARSNIGASAFNPETTSAIELNRLGSGNRSAYLDMHSADGGADYHARILRSSGVNGKLQILQTGTGDIELNGGGNLTFKGKQLATSDIATTAINGLMSAADKTKLDGITDGSPIPTSSVLPVGYSCLCVCFGASVANNATTAGSNLGTPVFDLYRRSSTVYSFAESTTGLRRGTSLTGVWRNISGSAIAGAGEATVGSSVGMFVRIS